MLQRVHIETPLIPDYITGVALETTSDLHVSIQLARYEAYFNL